MSGGSRTTTVVGRRVSTLALVGAAVLLVLIVCGAAARSGSWASSRPPSSTVQSPTALPAGSSDTQNSTPTPVDRGVSTGVSIAAYVLGAFTLLLLVLGAILVADLFWLPPWRWWRRPAERPEEELAEVSWVSDDKTMPAAVDEALRQIDDQPDAREAVVRAWLLLGEAAAVAGTARRPSESAREYARRLAAKHRLPTESLERLASLYREARFSDHEMLAEQRAAARHELFALQTALADAVDMAGFA